MHKMWLFIIILITLLLGVWLFGFVIGCGSTNSTTSLTTDGGGQGNLPPLGGDIRVSLEALYTQYGETVSKNVMLQALDLYAQENRAHPKGPAQQNVSYGDLTNGGTTVTERGELIKYASVVDAAAGQDGKVRLYFVDGDEVRKVELGINTLATSEISKTDLTNLYNDYYFRTNSNSFSMAIALDDTGTTFEVKPLRLIGLPESANDDSKTLCTADPSILELSNGDLRLYFFCAYKSEITGDIAEASHHYLGYATSFVNPATPEAIYGQDFYYGGIIYNKDKDNTLADPDVGLFEDGKYRCFLQGTKLRMITSSNGVDNWSEEELLFGGVGGGGVDVGKIGSQYRMYFSSPLRQWKAQTSGVSENLNAVFFLDSNHAWAVGNSGKVLFYNGVSWTQQTSNTSENLNAVHFSSANLGWAVGDNGTILKYNGSSWSKEANQTNQNLFGVHFEGENTGFVVGAAGLLLKYSNGSWAVLSTGVINNLYSLWFDDSNNGWIVGGGGIIFSTTDGGTTLTQRSSGTAEDLRAICSVSGGTYCWAAGDKGKVLYSTDRGITWNAGANSNANNLKSVFFVNSAGGWAVGESGTILRTLDGGQTWFAETNNSSSNLFGVNFVAQSWTYGLVVGTGGTVLYGEGENKAASAYSADGSTWTFDEHPGVSGRGTMAPVQVGSGYKVYFN